MATATAPLLPSRRFQYPSEFFVTVIALIFTILVVHATYVAWIRPNGDAIIAAEQAAMRADPNYVPERSFFLVVNAPEQDYPRLAEQAMQGTLPGSSAGGEQPKFSTTLNGRAVMLSKLPRTPSVRSPSKIGTLLTSSHCDVPWPPGIRTSY